MKIFITGIRGFIGANLADYYLKKKFTVSGCDNLIGGYLNNINSKKIKLIGNQNIPIKILNIILTLGFLTNGTSFVNIYRLSNSEGASKLSMWIANKFRLNKVILKNE